MSNFSTRSSFLHPSSLINLMLEYDEFRAMNTTVQVAAEGERALLEPGFSLVRAFVAEAEERFSRFRETSELTALNRAAGKWFSVSAPMFSLLEEAVEVHERTSGLFDPTILGALKSVGYDRSMDEIRLLDSVPAQNKFAFLSPGFDFVELDANRQAIWMPREMQIDLGGIAKGWISAQAAERLAQFTEVGAVSAGGDMVLFGYPDGAPVWQISLEDPCHLDQVLAVLDVGPGAVATSSVTRRRWTQQDHIRHHIIDPRQGIPAESSWLSVTVYAEKATYAEAFAKALLIAGPEEAWDLAERVENLQFVAVQEDGSLVGNLESLELNYV